MEAVSEGTDNIVNTNIAKEDENDVGKKRAECGLSNGGRSGGHEGGEQHGASEAEGQGRDVTTGESTDSELTARNRQTSQTKLKKEPQEAEGDVAAQVLQEDSSASTAGETGQGVWRASHLGNRTLEKDVTPGTEKQKQEGAEGGKEPGKSQGKQGLRSKRFKGGLEGERDPDPKLDRTGLG